MEYRVSELAEKAGVTKRTIHYYISKGLLMHQMEKVLTVHTMIDIWND